jgi:hypothetical protein
MALRMGLVAWTACSGCSFPSDNEPFTPADEKPMTLVSVTLSNPVDPQPVNPVITVAFSDVFDPDTSSQVSVRLGGRGNPLEMLVEHNLVERKLVFRPKSNLVPNSEFQIDIGTSLRSLAGIPLDKSSRITFRTGSTVLPPPAGDTPLVLADIIGSKGELKKYCAATSCHAGSDLSARGLDLSAATPTLRSYLTSTSAVGSPEGLRLVQPGQPEKSYLLRKLLAGTAFARIIGDPMPVESAPLANTQLLAIQQWIRQGGN